MMHSRRQQQQQQFRNKIRMVVAVLVIFLLSVSSFTVRHINNEGITSPSAASTTTTSTIDSECPDGKCDENNGSTTKQPPQLLQEDENSNHSNNQQQQQHHEDNVVPPPQPYHDQQQQITPHHHQKIRGKLHHHQHAQASSEANDDVYDAFASWCKNEQGIKSLLHVSMFDYDAKPIPTSKNDEEETQVSSSSTKLTRGLAANRDISNGETVISIPLSSMITLNSIENDPILSPIIGRNACETHGWYDELQILIVYILYQTSLGEASSIKHYVNMLQSAPVEDMPFMWSVDKLRREYPDPTHGVRVAAEAIEMDVKAMYDEIVPVLVQGYPSLFAPPPDLPISTTIGKGMIKTKKNRENGAVEQEDAAAGSSEGGGDRDYENDGGGWMYSLDRFRWAFAMVNSRHWHLPVKQLDVLYDKENDNPDSASESTNTNSMQNNDASSTTTATTTSSVLREGAIQELTDERMSNLMMERQMPLSDDSIQSPPSSSTTKPPQEEATSTTRTHTFMVPMADLLNFGQPCTKGEYNPNTQSFDIIATCDLLTGQEVTFWYTDDCEDVVLANFGFTHSMIPKCDSDDNHTPPNDEYQPEDTYSYSHDKENNEEEDWKQIAMRYRNKHKNLERNVRNQQNYIQLLEEQLNLLKRRIRACGEDCVTLTTFVDDDEDNNEEDNVLYEDSRFRDDLGTASAPSTGVRGRVRGRAERRQKPSRVNAINDESL